jgi:hypothetical protein
MRALTVCLALLVGAPTLAHGQQSGSLLRSEARPGDRLTVTTAGGAEFSGRLMLDNAGELVLRSNDRTQAIAHADVVRVERRRNRFLFGPILGLGAGLAAGLPLKRRFDNEGANGDALLALSVGLGVGLGTVIDLFNGSQRTIYSRGQAPRGSTAFQVAPTGSGFYFGMRRVF